MIQFWTDLLDLMRKRHGMNIENYLLQKTESMRAQSDATALASLQSDYAAKEAGARPEGVK